MKMKKILAAVLVLAMLMALAACGSDAGTPYVPPVSGGNNSNNSGNNGDNGENDPVEVATWRKFDTSSVTETRTLTAGGCTITIAPVEYEDEELVFSVTLTNPTDVGMYLYLEEMAANDLMVDGYMYIYAEAGETSSDEITVGANELRLGGIFQLESLDLWFSVYDENWEDEELIHTTLYATSQEDVANADSFVDVFTSQEAQEEIGYETRPADTTKREIKKGVYISSIVCLEFEGWDEKMLAMEIVNENDISQYVELSLLGVNGLESEFDYEYCRLMPNTRYIFYIDFYVVTDTFMEAFGMTEISKLDFKVLVYDGYAEGLEIEYAEATALAFTYLIPDTTATVDTSATEIYNENGLKISIKEPVTNEWDETYIYFIFETSEACYVADEEIAVDGEVGFNYFEAPCWMNADSKEIAYLELDDLDATSVNLTLVITTYPGYETQDETIVLTIDF